MAQRARLLRLARAGRARQLVHARRQGAGRRALRRRAGADAARNAAAKGSLLKHDKLIDFIQRNYESDASGQWFFQNGPQRVYVELQATPWVWRVGPAPVFADHGAHRAKRAYPALHRG
jgi:hypothetical protein